MAISNPATNNISTNGKERYNKIKYQQIWQSYPPNIRFTKTKQQIPMLPKTCIIPKDQRKRCFINIFNVSGASVRAIASLQVRMVYPQRKIRNVRSQSSANVSVVKPSIASRASLRNAPIAPGTTKIEFT